jgi:hypothetical protein
MVSTWTGNYSCPSRLCSAISLLLVYRFEVKHLVHSTIKGYMSAIGRTNYILCGYEFDNNEFISLLVRNFSLEWASDCQTISWWEQVDSFIVLVHWNNSPRIDMWHHLDTLSHWNNSPRIDMSHHLDTLSHWNNSPRIDMSHHLDTLSWFRANQFMNWTYIF